MLLVIAGFELLGLGLSLMQGTQSATQEIEGEVIWSEETKTEENPLIVCVMPDMAEKTTAPIIRGVMRRMII